MVRTPYGLCLFLQCDFTLKVFCSGLNETFFFLSSLTRIWVNTRLAEPRWPSMAGASERASAGSHRPLRPDRSAHSQNADWTPSGSGFPPSLPAGTSAADLRREALPLRVPLLVFQSYGVAASVGHPPDSVEKALKRRTRFELLRVGVEARPAGHPGPPDSLLRGGWWWWNRPGPGLGLVPVRLP